MTSLAEQVLRKRYLWPTEATWTDLCRRVAKAVAENTSEENCFFEIMNEMYFIPNSPTLMNAGKPNGQLSACFVLPIYDSLEAICDAIKQAALIHKSGGGTGFDFSPLRPKGSKVSTTVGVASGPVGFIRAFDGVTEAVKQGGMRRGANMGILRIDHPDIKEFINAKRSAGSISNFNLSVAITDEFFQAVMDDAELNFRFPAENKLNESIRARKLFDELIEAAWASGEPGIIFIDEINRKSKHPSRPISATNPCGEQPLLPFESCNLGSINLAKFVKKKAIDYAALRDIIVLAVSFLDNVIDCNWYPLPEIEKMTKAYRKIGLGVMGWAEMLIQLETKYDSEEAINIAEDVAKYISTIAEETSKEIARRKGNFPAIQTTIYNKEKYRRNCTLTTIAPTGTLSIFANVTGGIEPIFATEFSREHCGEKINWIHPLLGKYSASLFRTAQEIGWEWHVRHQAAWQKYIDNAVSKTINFSSDATIHDIKESFLLAQKLGCKGLTVFRDGCRGEQVFTTVSNKSLKSRPKRIYGFTEKVYTGCGKIYITINSVENEIKEIFATTGKAGGCPAQTQALGKLISRMLRSGISAQLIAGILRNTFCPACARNPQAEAKSCPDAIGKAIQDLLKSGSQNESETKTKCPECGQELTSSSGCLFCLACGYSRCG